MMKLHRLYRKRGKTSEPELIYSVEISEECREEVRESRKRLYDSILQKREGRFEECFMMNMKITNDDGSEERFSYLVSQRYDHGPCSKVIKKLII